MSQLDVTVLGVAGLRTDEREDVDRGDAHHTRLVFSAGLPHKIQAL